MTSALNTYLIKSRTLLLQLNNFFHRRAHFLKSEAFSLTFSVMRVCLSFWHVEQEFDLNYSPLTQFPMVPFNDFV
jgi:hypothetical protein